MVYDFFSPLDEIKRIPSQKAGKNIEESYGYLSNDFSTIARIMREYNPLELIKLSLWDERKVLKEKKKDQRKNASASLMPVVLQSVLLSSYLAGYGSKRNISIKDWNRLKDVTDDILRRIIRIVENKTALFMSEGEKSRDEGEKYRSIISSYLIPDIITKESLKKDTVMLLSLLEEKWEALSFTSRDVNTYVINIDNIADKSLNGIDDLCMRVQAYSDEFALARAKKSEELGNKSEDEVYRIITKENGWEGRAEELAGERDGFDLYTLDKLTSLESEDFKPFTASAGALDMISLLKLGYWSAMRYPFVALEDKIYTFVGKHIPRFIALSASLSRREAALKDVSAIFFRTGIDTYTYDGNSIDISVLPSYYDSNIFSTPSRMKDVEEKKREELSFKASYGHKRLIVDPDQEEDMINGPALMISSVFMADAARNRNSKHELIKSLLGDLDFPEKTSEYNVIDEDELVGDVPVLPDDDDDKISDEYEYDNSDGDNDTLNESDADVLPPEYEKKVVDIKKEEEKYALTDEIIAKEEKESEEEEKYTLDLDDDIFDDSEEEERLNDIGEKEEDEYYIEEENEEQKEEEKTFDDDAQKEDEGDGQLDFFDLLDEEDEKDTSDEGSKEDDESDYSPEEETVLEKSPALPLFDDDIPDEEEEEEKLLDEEIEKEDEEEFTQEEEKAEELDDSTFNLPFEEASPDNEEKSLDEETAKEDEEEKAQEELDDAQDEEIEKEEEFDKEESLPSQEEPILFEEEKPLDEEDETVHEELDEQSSEKTVPEEETVDSILSDIPDAQEEPEDTIDNDDSFTLPSIDDGEDEVKSEENAGEEAAPSTENGPKNAQSSWLSAFMGLDETEDESEKEEESPIIEEDALDIPAPIEGEETEEEESTEISEGENVVEEDIPQPSPEDTNPPEEEHQILTMEELGDDEELPLVSDDKDEDIPYSGIIREIYQRLSSASVFADFLKDAGVQTAEELEEVIHNSWEKSRNEGKDKLFNIAQYSMSVIISHNLVKDVLRKSELYNNAGGVMYAYGSDKWTAILLYIDDSFSLSDAYEKTLTKESFSPSDWKRVTYIGEQIKNKAMNNG